MTVRSIFSKSQLKISSEIGMAGVFLIFIILIGIVTTTFLVQQRTNFLPKANDGDNGDNGCSGCDQPSYDSSSTDSSSSDQSTEETATTTSETTSTSEQATYDNQTQETKDMFTQAYGDNAKDMWNAEHAAEIASDSSPDAAQVDSVANASHSVQEARNSQSEIQSQYDQAATARTEAQSRFDQAVSRGDVEAAAQAQAEYNAADSQLISLGNELSAASQHTALAEANFNQAVTSVMSGNASLEQIGATLGHIAAINGVSVEEVASWSTAAAISRGGTVEQVAGAVTQATITAGGNGLEVMTSAYNAASTRSGGVNSDAVGRDAAITAGNSLGLSSDKIESNLQAIAQGHSSGLAPMSLADITSRAPGSLAEGAATPVTITPAETDLGQFPGTNCPGGVCP